jgi:hypothetical protein
MGITCRKKYPITLRRIESVLIDHSLTFADMTSNEMTPRLVERLFSKRLFVTKVVCGATHFAFLVSEPISRLMDRLITLCNDNRYSNL